MGCTTRDMECWTELRDQELDGGVLKGMVATDVIDVFLHMPILGKGM